MSKERLKTGRREVRDICKARSRVILAGGAEPKAWGDRLGERCRGWNIRQLNQHLNRTRARARRLISQIKRMMAAGDSIVPDQVLKPKLIREVCAESILLKEVAARLVRGAAYRVLTEPAKN